MTEASSYYYRLLNRQEQACYHAMREGILAMQTSFSIPLLDGGRLTDIFFMLRLDHPEIFWCGSFRYRYVHGAENGEMIPEYLFARNKIRDQQTAMQSRVKKLVNQASSMKEEERLLFLHDLLCDTVRYDKLKKAYSHEIIGPLGQGVGVCEGIAKSMKVLCDQLGVWCVIAVSEAAPEKKIPYRHAWNIIRYGGKYYHLDATFDNTLSRSRGSRHDYYMLSDDMIFRDHQPLIWKMPVCDDGKNFYYLAHKLSFTRIEDVRKRAAQAVKKKKEFLFHWRGGYLTKEVLDELLTVFHEEAQKRERFCLVSLNWPQAVLCVNFQDAEPVQEVIMEESDESKMEEISGTF